MKMPGGRFMLIGAGVLSLWAATFAQPVAGGLVVVPGSTKKVSQLTGDVDRALKKPTLSQKTRGLGIFETALGNSFEHKGNLYFLFGDTVGQPGALDAIGWTSSRDPEKIELDFH